MRNLKRALSLTLASVMLLGMMVVGSSAAAGYDDVADTDNVEAIEVLQAVEVMVGDERGFGPERPVNRAEMAVVMGKLLNLDYNYYEATCPFNDVYDWARGWVGACYANGIVSGRGEGVYDPGTTVTAVEAASMLMRALGYFKYQSDYASGFEVSTVLQANKIRLFDGVNSSTNEPLTRNQVAQMALNALKSGMVEPDGNALNFIDANGNVIATGGKVNYVFTTSNKPFAQAISKVKATSIGSSNDSPIVELGEQLYDGKLKLDETRTDVFGRPSRYWEYDGKEIGSYAKKELMVFDNVGEVTGLDLYNLLGKSTIDDYTLTVTVDGIDDPTIMAGISGADRSKGNNTSVVFGKADLNRNNKAAIGGTGTGVLMQVFVDHETDDIHVAVINTYLAIADKTYDEKKEEASVKVYAINRDTDDNYAKVITNTSATSTPDEHTETFKLGIEDFSLVKDIKKDDAYLVNVADGAVQAIEPAEVLADSTISAFKKNDHVVSGGTDYKYASTAGYNYEDLYIYTSEDKVVSNLKDITYNIYLDPYGNLIGLKANETPKNYVFLASIDRNSSYISNKTATATAIFLDGTSATIEINMDKSEWRNNRPGVSGKTSGFEYSDGGSLLNTWATYTKSGDLYTVKEVWNVYDHDTGKAEAYRAPDNGLTSGERNTTKLAQFHDITRNGKEITLKDGLRLDGGFGVSSGVSYSNVYGDSDSVYLTSELGTVNTKMGIFGIIKSAETVHTGIDGTSINVWTDTTAVSEADKDRNNVDLEDDTISKTPETDRVSQGVYTLYNDKGIVIAAMVVGEGSSSKDLVYVTSSDVDLESDNGGNRAAGDGLWTWTREVVRDGEKVMLSEVGDAVDALSSTNMKQHTWYQVKVDGNGNVTKAEPAFEALGDYDYLKDNKGDLGRDAFVDDYADINNAVEEKGMDTVLYHTNGGPNVDNKESKAKENYSHKGFYGVSELEVKGKNVLAVTTEQGSGIYFRSDVNVVLTYYNRNKNQTEVILGEGVDDLKEAVDFVNDNTKMLREKNGDKIGRAQGQSYYVSALIENGAATTVVIHDTYNNYEVGPITGTVTVKFKPGDYSDERNVFYDGNEKLSYDNGRITHYNNLYDMFRVTNGDGEVKVTRSSSNNDYYGDSNTDYVIGYYEDGSGLVIGHVSRSRTTLTFTADKNCILFDSRLFLDVTTVTPNKGDDLNSGFVVENDGKEQNLDSLTEYFLVGDGRSLPKPKAASYTDIGAATKFESGKTYTVEVKVGSGAYKVEGPFTCTTEGWLEVPVKLFKDLDEFYKYNDSVNGANIDVFFGQIMEVKIDDEPITGPIAVTGVSVDDITVEVNGDPKTLTPKFTPDNATDKKVTWSTTDTNGIIELNAETGAVKGLKKGTVEVTVTTHDGNKTAKCTVTVVDKIVEPTGVTVSPKTASVQVGKTTKLTATLAPVGATGTVTWSSDKEDIATVSADGTVTAKAEGTATITATVAGTDLKDTCTVTVTKQQSGGDESDLPGAPSVTLSGTKAATMTYYGDKRPDAKYIKDEMAKAGVALTDQILIPATGNVTAIAENGDTVTITLNRVFKVTLNGTAIGYVASTGGTIANTTPIVVFPSHPTPANAIDNIGNGTQISVPTGLTKDAELFTGYGVWWDSSANSVKNVKYENPDDTTKTTALSGVANANSAAVFLKEGAKITADGTVKGDNSCYIQFKAGKTLYGTPVLGGNKMNGNTALDQKYEYTVKGTDADANGKIELKEAKLYEVTVGTTSLGKVEDDAAGMKFDGSPATYLAVKNNVTTGDPEYIVADGSEVTTTAVAGENGKVKTPAAISTYARGDGTVLLVPAAKVTYTSSSLTKMEATVNGIKTEITPAGTTSWVAVGAADVTLTGDATGTDNGKYITVKVGSGKAEINGTAGTSDKAPVATISEMPNQVVDVQKVTAVIKATIDLNELFAKDTGVADGTGSGGDIIATASTGLVAKNTATTVAGGNVGAIAASNFTLTVNDVRNATSFKKDDKIKLEIMLYPSGNTVTLEKLEKSGITVKGSSTAEVTYDIKPYAGGMLVTIELTCPGA